MVMTVKGVPFPQPGIFLIELLLDNQWVTDTTVDSRWIVEGSLSEPQSFHVVALLSSGHGKMAGALTIDRLDTGETDGENIASSRFSVLLQEEFMATDIVSPSGPSDEGVHYERVDGLTVNMYVEGPGDTTVRPASAAAQAARERDRELIARLIARTRQEQDKLNARKSPPAPMDGVDAM